MDLNLCNHGSIDSINSEFIVILSFASSKGGVGKSMITSNLAIALARRGRRVIVVDADLGGGNLHTILGIRKPHRTLSDFMNREVAEIFDTYVYTAGLRQGQFSYSTAVGFFKSVVGLILVMGANWLSKRVGEEGIY